MKKSKGRPREVQGQGGPSSGDIKVPVGSKGQGALSDYSHTGLLPSPQTSQALYIHCRDFIHLPPYILSV